MLTDTFGRTHNYLRISLLERCNLRCTYCMPEEGIPIRDKAHFMTQEELLEIADVFINHGVNKIRLTGGEPLIKKNFDSIVSELGKRPVQLAITTNGILLDKYWDVLSQAGLKQINISLDSLQKSRFETITRRKYFDRVYAHIFEALERGFRTKINCVLMKGVNEDEIIDFISLTKDQPIHVRFIEFMPFDGNNWDWSKKVSERFILEQAAGYYGADSILSIPGTQNDTTRHFQVNGHQGQFGIISTLTNPFCDTCNRIRLTADGKIKNCLFSNNEMDLLTALRNGDNLEERIASILLAKKEKRAGITDFTDANAQAIFSSNRSMTTIGG